MTSLLFHVPKSPALQHKVSSICLKFHLPEQDQATLNDKMLLNFHSFEVRCEPMTRLNIASSPQHVWGWYKLWHKTSPCHALPHPKKSSSVPMWALLTMWPEQHEAPWGEQTSNGEKSYTCLSLGSCSYAAHSTAQSLSEECWNSWGTPAAQAQPQPEGALLLIQLWSCSTVAWSTEKQLLQRLSVALCPLNR